MQFRILGPLEVVDGGRVVDLGGPKQRALLAVLLLNANRVVSREQLIDAIWDEEPPETARKALQVYVSHLRKRVGAKAVVTREPGYMICVASGMLDLETFEELLLEARGVDTASSARKLRQALGLFRGRPLADLAHERFAQGEIARLDERRLAALEERIEAELQLGRHADLVGELEGLTREHPLRERLCRQHMLALYRCSRQAEALDAFQAARRTLLDDLGVDPGRDLRQLHQQILNQYPSLDPPRAGHVAVDAADGSRGAFVGREAEFRELAAGLEAAAAGHGQLFLLVGEPGVGKSRLADEVIRNARERGFVVLIGRAWEAGGAPAYWPWVQALRSHIRETEAKVLRAQLGTSGAKLVRILPDLRDVFPDLPAPASAEPESARFQLFDATAEFLGRVAESHPLLLFLDDLHAADTPSLLLLQFVSRQLGSMRMLVLAALRDVDPIPAPALSTVLVEMGREPTTRRLPLTGLSEQDVAKYLNLTAAETASPELIAALHDETGGNPLFVGETVRLLALEGFRSGGGIAIPQTVRDAISRRLSHLSEECNRVLALAAVLGREFALDALAGLGDVTEDGVLETLDEAMAARAVSDAPSGPGRLRFAHVLIRDTLYENLTTARRIRLHRRTVEVLEALYGEHAGPHLTELAHHSIAASDLGKGVGYAR